LENKLARPWDYVLERKFNEKLRTLEEAVTDGGVDDFAAYKYLCGQIRGIHFAIDCIFELRQSSGADEDRDLFDDTERR
jgi:hypothetical protein